MTRGFYQVLLLLHPSRFRHRFGSEMMSIFEEETAGSKTGLLLDAIGSLARQWLLRTNLWKILAAVLGAFLQVWGFGYRVKSYQHGVANSQLVTGSMYEVILFALILVACLFVAIVWVTWWTVAFQRRRVGGKAFVMRHALVSKCR